MALQPVARLFCTLGVVFSAHHALAAPAARTGDWSLVDQAILGFKNVTNMAFTVGTEYGRQHTIEKGFAMSRRIVMASASKFPVAVSVARAVAAGHLSFDTPAGEVFPWWTKDAGDKRSRVTLRHLLSFRSGMAIDDVAGGNVSCLSLVKGLLYSLEGCAKEIYDEVDFTYEPGTVWSYHSLHLQIAGAMAAKAAGNLTAKDFMYRYLLRPMEMNRSFFLGRGNPHLAATLVSTGDDYDRLLHKYFTYQAVPKPLADEMEKDYITSGVHAAPFEKDEQLIDKFGHYSMCLYYECVDQKWGPTCEDRQRHADPGAFGYWPLIDRKKKFYMQVVTQFIVVPPPGMPASEAAALPAITVAPLRFALQPLVEQALGRNSTEEQGVAAMSPAAAAGLSKSGAQDFWQQLWQLGEQGIQAEEDSQLFI